MEVGAFK